jgi:predicted nucleic acid-binding protein
MKVVCNSSPLIFLSKLQYLDLLQKCFVETSVARAVVDELAGLNLPSFLNIKDVSQQGAAFVRGSIGRLHQGELETIVLAQETNADFALLDDLLARKQAEQMGVKPLGTLGVLLLAKKQKHLTNEAVLEALADLRDKYGMYISSTVLEQVKNNLGN